MEQSRMRDPGGDEPGQTGADRARRDAALVQAAREGDRDALTTLLRTHESQLFAICMRMVGHRESARDLTQEAMIRIIEGLHTFDGRARFSTWMTRVTMNLCVSHLRKEKLRRHASLDGTTGPRSGFGQGEESRSTWGQSLQSGEPSPDGCVERTETLALLDEALALLDPEQRSILILRDVQGLDYRQIADALDVVVGTVKSRLFRARAALREQLEGLDRKASASGEQRSGE